MRLRLLIRLLKVYLYRVSSGKLYYDSVGRNKNIECCGLNVVYSSRGSCIHEALFRIVQEPFKKLFIRGLWQVKKNRSRDMQISKLENKFVMELISAPKKLVVLFGVIKKHYPLVVLTYSFRNNWNIMFCRFIFSFCLCYRD